MLGSIRRFISDNPWRLAAILLGVGLIGTVAALVRGGEPATGVEPPATTTTTTVVASSVPSSEGPATTAPPAAQGTGSLFASVKIDNSQEARPQVGLAGVPLLIEYPVEGGITRFTAVLGADAAGEIGPVRSLRPVDADLLPMMAPYLVSTGGQPFVVQDVAATGVIMIDGQVVDLFTFGDRDEPISNYFLLVDELMNAVEPAPGLGEGLPSGDLPAGSAAPEVTLPFGSASYRFEEDRYVRYEGADPFQVLDAIGGEPVELAHDTLLVMFVAERPAGYVDSNEVEVSDFDVIGSGDMLVFHGGQVVSGTWARGAWEDGYTFLGSGGETIGVPEGRTYLALVPRGSTVGY